MAENKMTASLKHYFSESTDFKWEMAFKSLLAGAAAGLLAVVYRLATEKGVELANTFYNYIKIHPIYIIPWLAAAIAGGLFIAWLIRLEPMASGGGVPQVEGVVLYGMKMKWYLVIAVRYVAGILGSIFGLSFGPEGPSIQLGAAVNQGIAKKLCKTKIGENYLVTAGAAAGLSTAFGAPLTGMIFALEEIHRNFSPAVLLSATTASLTADFISKYTFGLKPVVYLSDFSMLPLKLYWWIFPLAIFVSLFGIVTNRGFLIFQKLYGKLPQPIRPVIALLLCLPCGLYLPQVLGGGHDLIYILQNPNATIPFVLLLLAVKILFSCTSFGSGTPGGIFMPIISISALSGSLFALIAVKFGFPSQYISLFVICAMAAGLASCVKAPVTSIILTVEMVGSFTHILPVAICTFVALLVSDLLRTQPIYEALLKRYMARDDVPALPSEEKRGEIVEFPVEVGSKISNQLLRDVTWPHGILIVGLRRGSEEFIPKGDTSILPGDYLLVLVPENRETVIRRKMHSLCSM
jgi:H+/Cl- antiporter ClcA